ncbi:Uncharacterized conserved protein, DUF58 family, contains vWF domain [Lentzea xinjiangensis]|uniref:Uncharacterized conserved protein, DUF58 family, contains vWF domain n=1 Tax=Lentzea xinjiangensis TaxID=402600 RepID=A0A1H9GSE3_9PSEU|nr:DUF58 domain-containing protein [Lentzea xinjiangensis]SEQ53002.1 Uncharacterized conserved protein, DUF58 family, contains vWF domain [Lentzea xinjiangensis]
MRTALSGLTTRGRCLLAAGFAAGVCAAVLNERDLLRVAAFVIALPLLAAWLATRARVGLHAARFLAPGRVPVGAAAEVKLDLRSTGRLPTGGLMLEDTVPYALGARPRFLVERLPRNTPTALRYPLKPVMRGIQQVGPLMARITDPFGLAEFDRELAGRSRLVVVPRVVRLAGLPGGSGMGAGDDGSVRLRAGQGEDDAIVRQYRQGDDLRKVHWRSTARRDELMVRVEERPWRGGTTVLLDHRVHAHRGSGPTASLEWAISFVASLCLHLHHFGHQVRLVSEDGRVLAGGSADGGHSDHVVLDSLAALQASHRRELSAGIDPGAGQEVVAVLGAVSPASVEELIRYRPRGMRSLAVLLDVNAWAGGSDASAPDPEDARRLLTGAGWGVVIARPSASMQQVWQELCASAGNRGPSVRSEVG